MVTNSVTGTVTVWLQTVTNGDKKRDSNRDMAVTNRDNNQDDGLTHRHNGNGQQGAIPR